MTQEDKNILLKDLCARLPYKVKVLHDYDKKFKEGLVCYPSGLTKYENRTCITAFGVVEPLELDEIKPYLRSMDSMTEDEERELEETVQYTQFTLESYDYLNSIHVDYRGLIEKNLALEAKPEMYRYEV